jgi:aminoglycoside phosphotransferase
MGKRGLALGFESWASAYIERERRNRVLRLAGAKLTRPKLVACYGHWRRDWFVDSALEAKTSLRERLKLQTTRLAEAEAAAMRWRAELQSAREQPHRASRSRSSSGVWRR